MTDAMRIYDQARSAPADAVRPIVGGTYAKAGLSDVNPQWRIERMTEIFGPCGTGWSWSPVDVWTEHNCVFAHVVVTYTLDGQPSQSVHGYGGTALGGDNSDIIKKSITDALGNALRYMGIGADVWYKPGSKKNQYDTKYSVPQDPDKSQPAPEPNTPDPKNSPAPREQKNLILARAGDKLPSIRDKYGEQLERLNAHNARRVLEALGVKPE